MTWTFPFISCVPTDPCISHTCYPPISSVPLRAPYFPYLLPSNIFRTPYFPYLLPSNIFRTPSCPLFPILVTLQYLPYPFVTLISHNFLLFSTSLVLYLGQLVHLSSGGLVIVFYLIHYYLSSGLPLEQIVGLSLVHSSLCFLGCESWVRLN